MINIVAIFVAIILVVWNTVLMGSALIALQHGQFGLLLVALIALFVSGELLIKPLFRLVGEQGVRKHLAKRNKGE